MIFLQATSSEIFNWQELLFGEDHWSFIFEVVIRSIIMFFVSLATLRILGKRGLKQEVFEVVVIITLGSAAGDAMFYKKVGLVPAILVFVMIIALYKLITLLVANNKWFQHVIEGRHMLLVHEGRFSIQDFTKYGMPQDEFFSDLRLRGVSQLGQVSNAYVETSGEISLFFYPDEKVKYGLPILPEAFVEKVETIPESGFYSCNHCGNTEEWKLSTKQDCPVCGKNIWVRSSNERRVR